MQKVKKGTEYCAKKWPVKCKLTISALGTPSLDHIATEKKVYEHTKLHLILSDCMSSTEVENLNKIVELFNHFHIMILHAKPNIICKILQYEPDYASQKTVPIKRIL